MSDSVPPTSKKGVDLTRWTPAAVAVLIAALIPLVQELRKPDLKNAEKITNLELRIEAQEGELTRIKGLHQSLKDEFSAYKISSEKWGSYVDGGLCLLGVRPPYGCPVVELLPKPLRGGGAAVIQPRIEGLKRLGE